MNNVSMGKLIGESKIKLRSSKSSEHFNEKGNGSYRGFGYLSLFSDPIDLATRNLTITVILFLSTE